MTVTFCFMCWFRNWYMFGWYKK